MIRRFFRHVEGGGWMGVHKGVNFDDFVSTPKHHGCAGPTQEISVKT